MAEPELENLDLLAIDGIRVDFTAAAIFRRDEVHIAVDPTTAACRSSWSTRDRRLQG